MRPRQYSLDGLCCRYLAAMDALMRLLYLLILLPAIAFSEPATFSQAKRALSVIYEDHLITFYCGCRFDSDGIDAASCGLVPRKQPVRASRVEWEHVVPAHELGGDLPCWQKGGRRACRSDPLFQKMESDMHNLVPSVGELNGDRSNFRYGIILGEAREYGACDFEVDFSARVAEPKQEVRGDVARTYFYMFERYGLELPPLQQALFRHWSNLDPVDDWERERAARVERLQGRVNRFVE